jgi:mRNA interferase RelE/StbE
MISMQDQKRVIARIEGLENNLAGDVKRLTDHTFEYRLRVGPWRVLFEIENNVVII